MKWLSFVALAWLTGCPGFGSDDVSVLTAIPDQPSFTDVAPIMATYCVRCHNPTNLQGDFQSDTYDACYKGRHDIEGEIDQGLMPPLSDPPMSKIDRATVLKWIKNGAPETVEAVDNGDSEGDDTGGD